LELNAFLDAADHGRLDDLRAGLAAGLDVNAADTAGWTALLTAVRATQLPAVQLLLEAGADVHVQRAGGFGPLHLLIEAAKAGCTPEHLQILGALLGAGADPNQQTSKGGQSPVRNAAALGLGAILQLLVLADGVDLERRDTEKATPLYAAADGGSSVAVALLLEVGADPNAPDRYGRTPLHAAAIVGNPLICGALLKAGADPLAVTRFPVDRLRAKSTPRTAAELMGHEGVVALLAKAEAPASGATVDAGWPDADSPAATWLAAVLLGKTDYPTTQDDHHVLDAVFGQWRRDAERPRLLQGFRGLLVHENPRLRAASVHFYVRFAVPDDGAVLRAWTEHPGLYRGVQSPWYPEDTDLAGLLAAALSRYSFDSDEARDQARAAALTPGQGAQVVAGLLAADRAWLVENLVAIVQGSPDALAVVLGSARMRGLDPEGIMRGLIGRIPDDILIQAIRDSLPEWRVWLDAVVAEAERKAAAEEAVRAEQEAAEAERVAADPSPVDEHRRLIGQLLDHDASEVFDKLEQLLDTAPQLGEALLLEMAARKMDLRGAIALLRDRVERDTLKGWVLDAVPDELERLVYLAMI
jgi:ankyrin repeat protein